MRSKRIERNREIGFEEVQSEITGGELFFLNKLCYNQTNDISK